MTHADEEQAFWDEVKPITRQHIVEAVMKAKLEYRPTADIDYLLFLRELGIEVED